MSKIDAVRAAMVEAMKAKDKARKDSLSMLLSALKNAEINKRSRAEISAAKSKLNKLKDLYLNDIITLEELKTDREALLAKISDLEKAALPEQKQDFESIDRVLTENWKESYDGLNREEKREFWRIIVKEIKIYPDRHIEYSLNV